MNKEIVLEYRVTRKHPGGIMTYRSNLWRVLKLDKNIKIICQYIFREDTTYINHIQYTTTPRTYALTHI